MAMFLERLSDPFGMAVVSHPGLAFRMLMVVTLTAATAAFFALASAIGEWGIGNGFCWLLALAAVQASVRQWRLDPRFVGGIQPAEILFGALWIVPVVALVAWLELRGSAIPVSTPAGKTLELPLPPLPQGVVPLNIAESIVAMSFTLPALSRLPWLSQPSLLHSLAGRLLLIPAFSLLAFALFGTRNRLAANLLPAAVPAHEVRKTVDSHWALTTAALTAGSMALYLIAHFILTAPFIQLSLVVMLTAFVLDLRDELRFTRRHGSAARLLQLDNVHLASYLQALLRQQDIDVLARAFRFRSLFYFLNPLVKIELRVPAESLETAAGLLAAQELRIL